jgi:hypothetical protein
LTTFDRALGKVHTECDASHVRDEAIQHDFFAQACVSSSGSRQLTDLNQTLAECRSFFACVKWTWRCERQYWRRSRNATCIPRRAGPIGGTRQDPCAREWDQWRVHRRGRATIAACHGDFQRPGRPGHAARLGHSPTPKVSS